MRRRSLFVAAVVALAVSTTYGAGGAPASKTALRAEPARFACYLGEFSGFRRQVLDIRDELSGFAALSVVGPELACAPAPGDSTNYLACYVVVVRVAERSSVRRRLEVTNELSRGSKFEVLRLVSICISSARVNADDATSPSNRRIFACYAVQGSLQSRDVSIRDEFGRSRDAIARPLRLCAPAARKGAKVAAGTRFLGCYAVESKVMGSTIVVRNGFGALKAILGPRVLFCTAATLQR